MNFSEKHPKTKNTKRAHMFHNNSKIFGKMTQYKIQRVNFVLRYSKIKNFKSLVQIIEFPFRSAFKWERT